MVKKTFASILLACLCAAALGQIKDPAKSKTHYFGVQANQLLRQLLNFSSASNTVSNPYLLNYSVNSDSTGLGLNVGFGYSFDEFKTGDAVFERTSKLNDLFFRIGIDHKYRLGKKWLTSWGIDIVVDNQSNKTITKNDSDFNKSEITTTNKLSGFGLGPRFTLNYSISEHLLLGTELTYYFKSLKNSSETKSKVTTREFDPITGQERNVTRTEETDTDDDFKKLQLNVPAVLFLTLKF
jgi:hypothetical protein